MVSLFSGAMGLDLGLEQAGLETRVCVEFDPACCNTIRLNRPNLRLLERDIRNTPTSEILQIAELRSNPFCVVGGPPCQPFSTGGKRLSILDPRGSLFTEFARVIRECRPSFFVFENVAQILTAAVRHRPIAERPGENWNLSSYATTNAAVHDDGKQPLSSDEMAGAALEIVLEEFDQLGYYMTFAVLNAADFGAPQRRLRFIMLGSRVTTAIALPKPTHAKDGKNGLPPWRTLHDALSDLREEHPLHSNYGEEFQKFFSLVPPGRNWRALPLALQKEAMGPAFSSGGGKTGFFRRLAWNQPAPTIVAKPNRKSSALCHPDEIRPLSVREYARLQGFPDSWQFSGGMHSQYQQIGNAVPIHLGVAIGRSLVDAAAQHDRAADKEFVSDLLSWKQQRHKMVGDARSFLATHARNTRKKSTALEGAGQERIF